MILPTNTWINVEKAHELPSEPLDKIFSINVLLCDDSFFCVGYYAFGAKRFYPDSQSFHPTHFMIIELPK